MNKKRGGNIRGTVLNQFLNWLLRRKNKLQYAENKIKAFLYTFSSPFSGHKEIEGKGKK